MNYIFEFRRLKNLCVLLDEQNKTKTKNKRKYLFTPSSIDNTRHYSLIDCMFLIDSLGLSLFILSFYCLSKWRSFALFKSIKEDAFLLQPAQVKQQTNKHKYTQKVSSLSCIIYLLFIFALHFIYLFIYFFFSVSFLLCTL